MHGHAAPDAVLERFHGNEKENAYKNSVPVWTMATNALTCAGYTLAEIEKRMNVTMHQSTIQNALIY